MITEKQWIRFIHQVYDAFSVFPDKLYIHGLRIQSVGISSYTIKTVGAGSPMTIYEYPASVGEKTLKELYEAISIREVNLRQIRDYIALYTD